MLRLTLHGSFALSDAAGQTLQIKSRRGRALLAYLALSPKMTRSREEVMALLWSDRAEPQARGSLRQVLTGLRKDLGAAAEVLVSDNEQISLSQGQIMLNDPEGGELLAGFHLNDAAFEDWLRDQRQTQDTAAEADVDTDTNAPDVAVLPFDSSPQTDETEAFADGITEDIVTELTRFREFVVYAPWSSFHYAADDRTTDEIGQELEVDYVVEGSVRHATGRVRITAMLFDVETVNHVWVQRYDRTLDDVFGVQDEIAREVSTAVAIRVELDACELAALRRPDQRSAMDHVLLGERAQQRDWNAQAAAEHFEAALRVDPACARAYADLANWHACSAHSLFADPKDARKRTRAFAEQALSHQENDALVLANLADAYAMIGDFTVARQCLDKAVQLNPNHHAVMGFAASALPRLGDVAGAVEWLERYQRHDPVWQTTAMVVAFEVLYVAGRFDEAVAAIARMQNDLPFYLLPLAAAAQAQCGALDVATRLRQAYEAQLPEAHDFASHILHPLGHFADPALADLWLDGLRKAGFSW